MAGLIELSRRWMGLGRFAVVVGLASAGLAVASGGAGSAGAASPRRAESLGPAPLRCATGVHDCLGGLSYDYAQAHDEAPDSLTVSYLGGLVVSSHLVHVGEDVTAQIVGALTQPCYGAPHCVSGYNWSGFESLGKRVSGCVGGSYTATSCTVKVTAASRPPSPGGEAWDKVVVTICGVPGCANDEDFIFVQGSQRGLSGYVTDTSGKPVRNARVTIGGQYATTDRAGFYNAILDPGRYGVSAQGTGQPGKPTTCSPGSVSASHCNVDLLNTDGVADFQLEPLKHSISFAFAPSAVPADGTGHFDGVISDRDELGDPVTGQALTVSPPLDVNPPALVCSSHGLVYPTLLSDGSALGSSFQAATDAAGNVPEAIWPGTIAGNWLLDAHETGNPSTSTSFQFPFPAPPAAPFPNNDQISQGLYDAVRGTIGGTTGVNIFTSFNAVGQSAAQDQAVLLAFLQTSGRGFFPGADFGPVHEGNHAGILFYPRGSRQPTVGRTAVIDVQQAAAIVAAASSGVPLPVGDQPVPTLAGWNPGAGLSPSLGSLIAVPDQQLSYFGFPYPPPITSAGTEVSFYGPCLAPDPALEMVQVHSPVALLFTNAHGGRFGTGPSGRRIHTGPGFSVRSGDETTYAVPSGSYRVSVSGTGAGVAHLVTLTAGPHSERVKTFGFGVQRGEIGNLELTAQGPSGALRIGGRRVRATVGLALTVRGVPGRLARRRRRTLHLAITYFGQPIADAVIRVSGDGVSATAVTDRRGHATLSLKPGRRGTIHLAVRASSAAVLKRTVLVR